MKLVHRNFSLKSFSLAVAGIAMLSLASCGGNDKKTETVTEEETTAIGQQYEETAPMANNTIEIEGNDQMQFNKTEFLVKSGEKVTVTLKHVGKLSKDAMGHNFVLLKPGVDIADFSMKAVDAKETNYVPKSEEANVIAHTKVLGGGESDTIEFTAPAPGTYEFICSFPGHSSMMKGTLTVE